MGGRDWGLRGGEEILRPPMKTIRGRVGRRSDRVGLTDGAHGVSRFIAESVRRNVVKEEGPEARIHKPFRGVTWDWCFAEASACGWAKTKTNHSACHGSHGSMMRASLVVRLLLSLCFVARQTSSDSEQHNTPQRPAQCDLNLTGAWREAHPARQGVTLLVLHRPSTLDAQVVVAGADRRKGDLPLCPICKFGTGLHSCAVSSRAPPAIQRRVAVPGQLHGLFGARAFPAAVLCAPLHSFARRPPRGCRIQNSKIGKPDQRSVFCFSVPSG